MNSVLNGPAPPLIGQLEPKLKKVGPAADRLGLSHQQATAFLYSIINNSGGNLDEIAVSKSTARRSRATARAKGATSIKDSYTFLIGQINFVGKLLGDLEVSFDKVNRLTVVAVQEEGNQLLCIAKTDDSTGKVEAATVKEALDNWGSLMESSLPALTPPLPTPGSTAAAQSSCSSTSTGNSSGSPAATTSQS